MLLKDFKIKSPVVYRVMNRRRNYLHTFTFSNANGVIKKVFCKRIIHLREMLEANRLAKLKLIDRPDYTISKGFSPFFYSRYFDLLKKHPNDYRLDRLDAVSYKNYQNWIAAKRKFTKLLYKQCEDRKICEEHGIYDMQSDDARLILSLSADYT